MAIRTIKNRIGLDAKKSVQLAQKLNLLLCNYQLFYMNTRGFHWNVKGEKFFELHLKFEEMYDNALLKIDEIAERILTLGQVPVHTYSDYVKSGKMKELRNVSNGRVAIENIIASFSELILLEREILELSAEAGDEGTNALMSDYIREQEKLVWMFTAYLG
jgi:starvation-inducible DNA-binding protein